MDTRLSNSLTLIWMRKALSNVPNNNYSMTVTLPITVESIIESSCSHYQLGASYHYTNPAFNGKTITLFTTDAATVITCTVFLQLLVIGY